MNITDRIEQFEKRIQGLEKEVKDMKIKSNVKGQGVITLHNNLEVDKSAKISEILNRLSRLEV